MLIISKDQVYHHDKKMIITKPNLAQLEEHRTVKLVVIRWSPVRTREFGFFLFFCFVLDLEGLLFLGLIIFFNQEKEEFFRSFFEYFNIRDKKNKDYLLWRPLWSIIDIFLDKTVLNCFKILLKIQIVIDL